MMRELEFCVIGLFVIGIMLCLFIDVFKKNKSIIYSYQNLNEFSVEVPKPVEVIEVVYPMYIDCSRHTNQSLTPNDLLRPPA